MAMAMTSPTADEPKPAKTPMVRTMPMSRARAGRHEFTPKRCAIIIEAVRKGHYVTDASHLAGLNDRTVKRWLERGNLAMLAIADGQEVSKKERAYAEFVSAYLQADAQCTDEVVGHIKDQIPTQWIAGMTFLERRHPDRWRRRETVEHTGMEGAPTSPVNPHDSARVLNIINILVDNNLLPASVVAALRSGGPGPVIDAAAEPVHQTRPDDETDRGVNLSA